MRIDSDPTNTFRYPEPAFGDQDEASFGITPSQTVGPYVHIGLFRPGSEDVCGGHGTIALSIRVIDGAGEPIADAMVETWQTDPDGVHRSPLDPLGAGRVSPTGFRGLGRAFADDTGTARLTTVLPGSINREGVEVEAPHIKLGIFARGMLERLYTRCYFPEFAAENDADPVLAAVPQERRHLLVAKETEDGYHLDVVVQNTTHPENETPFFDLSGAG